MSEILWTFPREDVKNLQRFHSGMLRGAGASSSWDTSPGLGSKRSVQFSADDEVGCLY